MPGAAAMAPLPARPTCCTPLAGDGPLDAAPTGGAGGRLQADRRSSRRRCRLWKPALSCCSCACFQLDSCTGGGAAGSAVRGARGWPPALWLTFSLLADREPGDACVSLHPPVDRSARLSNLQQGPRGMSMSARPKHVDRVRQPAMQVPTQASPGGIHGCRSSRLPGALVLEERGTGGGAGLVVHQLTSGGKRGQHRGGHRRSWRGDRGRPLGRRLYRNRSTVGRCCRQRSCSRLGLH